MMVVDPLTGKRASFGSKKTIVEVFKKNKPFSTKDENVDIINRFKNNNILRFY